MIIRYIGDIILTILSPNQNEQGSKVNIRYHHAFQTDYHDQTPGQNDFQQHRPHIQVLSGEAGAAVTEHLEDIVEALVAVKDNLKVAIIIIIYTPITVPMTSMN